METCVTGYNSCLPGKFTTVVASDLRELSFISGQLIPDRTSAFFPGRSDEKIMREDVKTSIIAVNQMLAEFSEKNTNENTDLYVANGVFIEDSGKHVEKIIEVYRQMDSECSELDKIKKLYQVTPPLLALQTLTNSTMSFIAQYAGIKGNNATYGNTSHAGFYAVQKAVTSLDLKENGKSIVCASNCGGVHSFLTFSSFYEDKKNWKESGASACLLFEKTTTAKNRFCRITKMKSQSKVSAFNQNKTACSWHKLVDDSEATHVIYSGAYTENEYYKDQNYCKSFSKNSFSFFPEYGNMGSANVIMSIIKGIELLEQGVKKVDIFDRDPYGRDCYIRIEK